MPRRVIVADPNFGRRLAELRKQRGLSYRDFVAISPSYVHELETGRKRATPEIAAALDDELGAGGELAALVRVESAVPPRLAPTPKPRAAERADPDDEEDALELARRVAASDVGEETIARLEWAVDDLATRYSVTPPIELIARVRRHLAYVSNLLEPGVRKTLGEYRRLLVTGAWLSLLGATIHIDLKQRDAASARLMTAAGLARQAGHDEIHAWCYETQAWSALTDGDYRRALDLSRTAQEIAPKATSAAIQATAQEGRAWARLGQPRETHDALARVEQMVSPLARPERPEHHYRYDPDKAVAYTATTLAWLGDPAAEGYARDVIKRLRAAEDAGGWPRRVAAAQIDLSLALLAADKHDEAVTLTQAAILSGRIVPSNHWRAAEVLDAVETRGLPEARDLRAAYESMRRGQLVLPAAPE
jgi:transcriptional regulator with XRE-family HTH domain